MLVGLAVLAAACHAGTRTPDTSAAPDPSLAALVDTKTPPPFVGHDDNAQHVWQEERRFYKQNGEHLVTLKQP